MKRMLYAATAALCLAANVHAAVFSIDDFTNNQGPVEDTSKDGLAVIDTINTPPLTQPNVLDRTLSHNLLDFSSPIDSAVQVGGGVLDITNGVGENSEVKVIWSLKPNLILGAISSAEFFFTVVASDANATTVKLDIGGTLLGNFDIAGNTENKVLKFALPLGLVDDVNQGGKLTLTLNGAKGWDLALNQVGLTTDGSTPTVPEPSTISLLGLGLLGLGWSRWKRSANAR